MENNSLISVIIPVYNVKNYLCDCIDSVLNQKYQNFETILVDDGSTDGSEIICDEYSRKYPHIRVIHKENGGPSSARNIGVFVSKGEYICYVDSDDIISENYLDFLYQNAVLYNADVSICGFQPFWKKSDISVVGENNLSKINVDEIFERLMRGGATELIIACNKLIKRNVALKISFPLEKRHEDEFYLNCLLENAKVFVETSAKLYFYRQRSDSFMGESNQNDPRHIDLIEAFAEREEVFRRVCGKRMYKKIIFARHRKKLLSKKYALKRKLRSYRIFQIIKNICNLLHLK